MAEIRTKQRYCPACKRVRPLSEFHRKGPGYHSWCKGCVNARTRVLRAYAATGERAPPPPWSLRRSPSPPPGD